MKSISGLNINGPYRPFRLTVHYNGVYIYTYYLIFKKKKYIYFMAEGWFPNPFPSITAVILRRELKSSCRVEFLINVQKIDY